MQENIKSSIVKEYAAKNYKSPETTEMIETVFKKNSKKALMKLRAADAKSHLRNLEGLKPNIPPVPRLPTNPEFPHASHKLKLVYSDVKGRHVVCTEDISQGELLFVEPPLVAHVDKEYARYFCNFCYIRVSSVTDPVECEDCSLIYCSAACKYNDVSVHKFICASLTILDDCPLGAILAIKCFLTENRDPGGFKAPFCAEAPSHYLVWHVPNSSTIAYYTKVACLLVNYLDYTLHFFDASVSEADKLAAVELMTVYMLQLLPNTQTIQYIHTYNPKPYEEIDVPSITFKTFGSAIYPSSAMMNHSCDCNTLHREIGNTFLVYASRDIAAGSEICHDYGRRYTFKPRVQRQQFLKQIFHFKCECSACSAPREIQNLREAFICVKCTGPFEVRTTYTGNCWECNYSGPIEMKTIREYMRVAEKREKYIDNKYVASFNEMMKIWRGYRIVCHPTNEVLSLVLLEMLDLFGRADEIAMTLYEALAAYEDLVSTYPDTSVEARLRKAAFCAEKAAGKPGIPESRKKELLNKYKQLTQKADALRIAIAGTTQINHETAALFQPRLF